MGRIALVVRYRIAPGKKKQLLELLHAHVNRTLGDERGCLQFEVLEPVAGDGGDELRLFEVYQDAQAFDRHKNSAHLARYRAATAELLLEREVVECRLTAARR